jgi:hypothetical protein
VDNYLGESLVLWLAGQAALPGQRELPRQMCFAAPYELLRLLRLHLSDYNWQKQVLEMIEAPRAEHVHFGMWFVWASRV